MRSRARTFPAIVAFALVGVAGATPPSLALSPSATQAATTSDGSGSAVVADRYDIGGRKLFLQVQAAIAAGRDAWPGGPP